MKFTIVVALIAIPVALFGNFIVARFSESVDKVTVIEVEPGIRCARATTAHGTAIDCWKTN